MADSITLSRVGATEGKTPENHEEARQLFLKQYSGEVLTAFDETNVALDRSVVREISEGKSAQFPTIAKADAWYHKAGERIDGQKIKHDERVLYIDDLLLSATHVYQLDEAMSHFDVRGEYSTQQGRALARTADKHLFQVGVNAARKSESESPSGFPGGGEVVLGDAYDPDDIVKAMYQAAAILDKKDVPEGDRFFFCPPEVYYTAVLSDKAINRDFTSGNGDIATGSITEIAGIQLVKTNHLPAGQKIEEAPRKGPQNGANDYSGDFTDTLGLVWHRNAVGTVRLLDLAMEMEYQTEHQATLMVAKYAMGHGVLRPDCAVEVKGEVKPIFDGETSDDA